MRFADRTEAGRRLAARLLDRYAGDDVVVVGMTRGGVPVAAEVARTLGAPLDVVVVRKLGVPWQPELGLGAISEGGARLLNDEVVGMTGVSDGDIATVEARERAELDRRTSRFRGDRPPVPVSGRVAIVVDDGVATGSSARVACRAMRARGAARVVLAAPAGPPDVAARMTSDADDVVVVETPPGFAAVGQCYADFRQVTDDEVVRLVARAAGGPAEHDLTVDADGVLLPGSLVAPGDAHGVVVFAHGSGSSRHSPRNRRVAATLVDGGFATLLVDLLTDDEARDRRLVFDIDLLTDRLRAATATVRAHPAGAGRAVGLFGASTGAAAALRVAATDPQVAAVVSRGGRVDLAGYALDRVLAPTLLVVGGADDTVLRLNRDAQRRLAGPNRLEVVAGAGHLFEEPGALDQVADHARGWFTRHLRPEAPID